MSVRGEAVGSDRTSSPSNQTRRMSSRGMTKNGAVESSTMAVREGANSTGTGLPFFDNLVAPEKPIST
jgi:hypothetical protein